MKSKRLVVFLVIEAAVCLLFSLAQLSVSKVFTAAAAFPFEQIGLGLRELSLTGTVGNFAAVVFYVAICALPLLYLMLIRKKRKLYAEDFLLVALCPLLLTVLYFMINPTLLSAKIQLLDADYLIKAVLGTVIYSLVGGYIVLRALRLLYSGKTQRLFSYSTYMLYFLNGFFVFAVFGSCTSKLLSSITSLNAANLGNENTLGVTYVFLVLQFIVNALPYVLNTAVGFAGIDLSKTLGENEFSESAVACAERLALVCKWSLTITVLLNISYNILQLVFMHRLNVIKITAEFPVFSVAFVLAVLLLSRFVTRTKQLKDDNDMFI